MALSLYLDASVLVPLFVLDSFSERAEALLQQEQARPIVSDFAAAEFASAIGRRVRMSELTKSQGQAAFAALDQWSSSVAERVEVSASDIAAAAGFLRRLEFPLRTPDAMHIAAAARSGAVLATFDHDMARAAQALGLTVV
jgi:predicted nucleic acid-binding protein